MSSEVDLNLINGFLSNYFEKVWSLQGPIFQDSALRELKKSLEYSLLGNGKRFRPQLCLAIAEAFQKEKNFFIPYAASVEMIHTYSLIHDDLPSMDNDNFRRGQLTNHKVFGEAMALLAGDGLLTEAFLNISRAYREFPIQAVELTRILSEAAGVSGMIAGQVADLFSKNLHDLNVILEMHRLKTAALMSSAVEGASVLAGLSLMDQKSLREFGFLFGLAFQVADDLLDYEEGQRDARNIVELLGAPESQQKLKAISSKALEKLRGAGSFLKLENLLESNLRRALRN